MDDLKRIAKSIMENGYLMSLGTHDRKGVWVADVIYASDDDLKIYWLSKPDARHSQAISTNPKVAGTITLSNEPGNHDVGLQIEGEAHLVEQSIPEIAGKWNHKRRRPADNETMREGRHWFCLKPKRIEIIHGQLFGREKKVLEIQ